MQVVVQALPLYVCCGAGSAPFSVIRRITPTCSSAVATELTKKLLNVRWNTPLGATGAADAGAGVGAGAGAGGLLRSSLFSHPPNFIFAKPGNPRASE